MVDPLHMQWPMDQNPVRLCLSDNIEDKKLRKHRSLSKTSFISALLEKPYPTHKQLQPVVLKLVWRPFLTFASRPIAIIAISWRRITRNSKFRSTAV